MFWRGSKGRQPGRKRKFQLTNRRRAAIIIEQPFEAAFADVLELVDWLA